MARKLSLRISAVRSGSGKQRTKRPRRLLQGLLCRNQSMRSWLSFPASVRSRVHCEARRESRRQPESTTQAELSGCNDSELLPMARRAHGRWLLFDCGAMKEIFSTLASAAAVGESVALGILTRGHKHDALVLETWIHRPVQFLGMIGSARKARTITEHFVKEKIATAEEVARVACPVGIKIGSESVPEIAVSIMAQYIEKRAEL